MQQKKLNWKNLEGLYFMCQECNLIRFDGFKKVVYGEAIGSGNFRKNLTRECQSIDDLAWELLDDSAFREQCCKALYKGTKGNCEDCRYFGREELCNHCRIPSTEEDSVEVKQWFRLDDEEEDEEE